MHRTIFVLMILGMSVWLFACSSKTPPGNSCCSSNGSESGGLIHLTANENSKNASQGELVDFPITIQHDIRGNTAVSVAVTPVSGDRWRFALCYGAECFISDGAESIEKRIDLQPNTPMAMEIKVFVPKQISTGSSSTVGLRLRNTTTPQVIKTTNFTTTVK